MRAQDDERRRIAQMLHETTRARSRGLEDASRPIESHVRRSYERGARHPGREYFARRSVDERHSDALIPASPAVSRRRRTTGGAALVCGGVHQAEWDQGLRRSARHARADVTGNGDGSLSGRPGGLDHIDRHAKSEMARIRLRADEGSLELSIDDSGCGIPRGSLQHILAGGERQAWASSGMSERIKQLGGSLDIVSSGRGTSVRARLPLAGEPSDAPSHPHR